METSHAHCTVMALPGGLAQHQQQLVASKGCAMRPCLGRSVLVTPSAGRRLPVALKASSDGKEPIAVAGAPGVVQLFGRA